MIRFVKGDFFDYPADIRVNTVNCVGVMGAGVALNFKRRFPKMFEDYAKACAEGRVKIGVPHVWKSGDLFDSDKITIINFPTKDDWKKPSEYSFVELGLKWLQEYLKPFSGSTITVPALGCGHGGLDWNIVKPMIVDSLEQLPLNVLVFEPESSATVKDTVEIERKLENFGVDALLPGSQGYPYRLKGKSTPIIYKKGPIDFSCPTLSIVVNPKAESKEKEAVLNFIREMPQGNFCYLLAYNSSFEIDVVKEIASTKGNKVILTIPYGILRLKIRQDLKAVWNDERISVLSITEPDQPWSAVGSVEALKFRIKLASVILFTARNTDSIVKLAGDITDSTRKLFYFNYGDMNNDFYSRMNAKQIGRNRDTMLPNVSPILEAL